MLNSLFCLKYTVLTLLLTASAVSVQASILTIDSSDLLSLKKMVLVDARPIAQCLNASVSGARCLPLGTFHSENQQLASFYHINWVFGTMGLAYDDEVLVFADRGVDRDAVAGLLFLAGQLKVSRWAGSIDKLQKQLGTGPGRLRGIIRTRIYSGTTRNEFMAMAADIPTLLEAGWTVSRAPIGKQNIAGAVIVTASSAVVAIAEFTVLLASGHQSLMVVVDAGNDTGNDSGVDVGMIN